MLRALLIHGIDAWNRVRLRWLRWLHPGLEIDPRAGSNLAVARYRLGPGARLRIGPGVVTERLPGRLHFLLEAGAQVEIRDGSWLRTEIGEVYLVAFEGARIEVGPGALLNACYLSAKRELRLAKHVSIGPGSRVFDSDQHDLDDAHLERSEPVSIGEYVWIASDCTVLRGARIGAHSVVGARSLVTSEIPPHSVAFGQPARPRGAVGDRSRAR